MAQSDNPGSLQTCALRFARLAADGTTPAGANNGLVTKSFATLAVAPDTEAGQEFVERDACGSLSINYRDRDLIKRWTLTLTLLTPDPELEELLTSAPLITGVPGQRTITDASITTSSPTLISASANFTSGDVGKPITGTGIPVGTRISAVVSTTTVTMSANATATNAAATVIINGTVVVTDGATTTGSATVTSASANFTADSVGKAISGTGIPAGATILTVNSATSVTISANATATGTTLSLTITPVAQSIGVESIALGITPTDNGVSMEAWTKAVVGGSQAAVNPWFHWAFPKTLWAPGETPFGNEVQRRTFTGFAVENLGWGNGPWNDWRASSPSPFSLTRSMGRFRSNDLPNISSGYTSVPTQV